MAVEGIILAAGLSSRMGKNKMTLKIENKTVLERCIDSMYDLCSKIIVVSGYNYNIISEICRPYSKVKILLNSHYMDGMFSSVKLALMEVTEDRFFLIPGDYPAVKKETYEKMLNTKGNIVVSAYQGKTGHPVLIESKLIAEILKDGTYSSLRDFINVMSFTTAEVEDEGILMDIDTSEDYEKVLAYCQKTIHNPCIIKNFI